MKREANLKQIAWVETGTLKHDLVQMTWKKANSKSRSPSDDNVNVDTCQSVTLKKSKNTIKEHKTAIDDLVLIYLQLEQQNEAHFQQKVSTCRSRNYISMKSNNKEF